jgi:small GTP-binding protein
MEKNQSDQDDDGPGEGSRKLLDDYKSLIRERMMDTLLGKTRIKTGDQVTLPPRRTFQFDTLERMWREALPGVLEELFFSLPLEIQVHIFGFIDASMLASASMVCKAWYKCATSETVFKLSLPAGFEPDPINTTHGALTGRHYHRTVFRQWCEVRALPLNDLNYVPTFMNDANNANVELTELYRKLRSILREINKRDQATPVKHVTVPQLSVLLLGPPSAGKTSLLYRLKTNCFHEFTPSIGCNRETVMSHGTPVEFIDVGGHEDSRKYWDSFENKINALALVIDTTQLEHDSFSESIKVLASVLSQARIKVPTFIWATKQDESYCDAYQLVVRIMAALKFPILQERFNERGWVVQPVSARMGFGLDLSGLVTLCARAKKVPKSIKYRRLISET